MTTENDVYQEQPPQRRPFPTESDMPMHGWRPYSAIHRERIRAHAKHDGHHQSMERRTWDDSRWLPVLVEEVGEVARAICDGEPPERIEAELIQVAAMAAAWIDAFHGWSDDLIEQTQQWYRERGLPQP